MKVFLLVWQSIPVFIFANQAGLDMLETTLVALQDITLDKIFDESVRKELCPEFTKLMQEVRLSFFMPHDNKRSGCPKMANLLGISSQGFAYMPSGICLSTMGRHVTYEQAIAWKVLSAEENTVHCLAFSFMNWSFV